MGVDRKLEYREFLRSEEWQTIRSRLMVHFDATCVICHVRDLHNDIHHVTYPEDWSRTSLQNVVCLCRACHEAVHEATDGLGLKAGQAWSKFHKVQAEIQEELGILPLPDQKLFEAVICGEDPSVQNVLKKLQDQGLSKAKACETIIGYLLQGRILITYTKRITWLTK